MKAGTTCLIAIALVVACAVVTAGAAPRKPPRPQQRAAVAKARASILQRNLIANGDAELEEDGFASGWVPREVLESELYGHTAGEWDHGVNGGPGARDRYLRLPIPDGRETIEAEQWIALRAESLLVDTGMLGFTLSALVGGLIDQPGTAVLSAAFVGGDGAVLAEVSTEPVQGQDLPKPAVGSAALVARSRTGTLPAGTRRVHVTLTARRLNFAACPNCSAVALADRLSLVLSRPRSKPLSESGGAGSGDR